MKGDKAPDKRSRPWDARHETKHPDGNGAADHEVHKHRFELAGDPGRPATAGLCEKQNLRCAQDDERARDNKKIHTFMISASGPPGLPFDLLDMLFGEWRLSPGNPNADVALGMYTSTPRSMLQRARFSWASGFPLDMKLGGRMLAKYPVITLVGGVAMAFALWFGTVTFVMFGLVANPKLPLPDGDRIVQLFNWDTKANVAEKRMVHEFLVWRGELRSVKDLGAFRD